MRSSSAPLVVVKFDLWDGSQVIGRYASSHAMTATITGPGRVQFLPVLLLPIQVGTSISGFNYGDPIRVAPNVGSIKFALVSTPGKDTYSWLDLQWQGRRFHIYAGVEGNTWDELTLVYTGVIVNISHDTLIATVTTSGSELDFDRPLVEVVYGQVLSDESKYFDGVSVSTSGDTVTFSGGSPGDALTGYVSPGDTSVWTEGLDAGNLNTPMVVLSVTSTTIQYDTAVAGASGTWSFFELVPDAVAGRPKQQIWGICRGVEPVLIDEATLTYHVSHRRPIEVTFLTVGGLEWTYNAGTPGSGEWTYNANRGTVTLGSTPLNGQIRVNVRSFDYASMTTAFFVRSLVEELGGAVLDGSFDAVDTAAPYLIGYCASAPVSRLSVIDEAMAGIVAVWYMNPAAEVVANVVSAPPDPTVDMALTVLNIDKCRLQQNFAEAYRAQVEYQRNWHPLNQFFDSVTEVDQQKYRTPGLLSGLWEDPDIQTRNPRAVDVPVIRSLVEDAGDALDIRQRLIAAAGTPRSIYEVEIRDDATVTGLYRGVSLEYRMITGPVYARIHSIATSIGEHNKTTLVLWG